MEDFCEGSRNFWTPMKRPVNILAKIWASGQILTKGLGKWPLFGPKTKGKLSTLSVLGGSILNQLAGVNQTLAISSV